MCPSLTLGFKLHPPLVKFQRIFCLFLVLIAEVTQISMGVGYEIGRALERGKIPILCLFRPASGKGWVI